MFCDDDGDPQEDRTNARGHACVSSERNYNLWFVFAQQRERRSEGSAETEQGGDVLLGQTSLNSTHGKKRERKTSIWNNGFLNAALGSNEMDSIWVGTALDEFFANRNTWQHVARGTTADDEDVTHTRSLRVFSGDVQHEAYPGERRHERGSAGRHERQWDSGDRQDTEDRTDVDEGLHHDPRDDTDDEKRAEPIRTTGNDEPRDSNDDVAEHHDGCADKAELFGGYREDEVVVRLGKEAELAATLTNTDAGNAAVRNRDQ